MKRWLCTLPILLVGMAGLVRADYFLLVANTNPELSKTTPSDVVGVIIECDHPMPFSATKRGEFERGGILPVTHGNYKVNFSRKPDLANDRRLSLYTYTPTDKPNEVHALPNVNFRFEQLHTDTKNKLPPKELAEWALTHGMVGHFTETMDKWVMDESAKGDPVAANYLAIKAKINAKIDDVEPSSPWVKRLGIAFKRELSDHYLALYTDLKFKAEVRSRLDRLEDAFKTFYYWHALHGKLLPVPRERLLVFVNANEDEENLKDFRAVTDGGDAQLRQRREDGFFARREGILYLNLSCREPNYEKLLSFVTKKWLESPTKAVTVEALLKAPQPAPGPAQPDAWTMCLAVKVLEADAERMTVSHHGSRQLAYAAGLLPRYVIAPEWIQYGVGSFFETPLGSPWPSPTAPSSLHLKIAKDILGRKGADVGEILTNLVQDKKPESYLFKPEATDAERAEALAKATDAERAEILAKSRALSWALAYYLLKKEPDRFWAYRDELDKMPRDLPLDPSNMLGCFARAFGAVDTNTGKPDPAQLKAKVAEKWKSYITQVLVVDDKGAPLTGGPVFDELRKNVKSYVDSVQPKKP